MSAGPQRAGWQICPGSLLDVLGLQQQGRHSLRPRGIHGPAGRPRCHENTAQRAIDYVWLGQRRFREQDSFELDPKG